MHWTPSLLLLVAVACSWTQHGTATPTIPSTLYAIPHEAPSNVIKLTEDDFDKTLFPPTVPFVEQSSHIVFFYAPWCGHCKAAMPHFLNASAALFGQPSSAQHYRQHSSFAMVDAIAEKALAKRFAVRSYPTILYSLHGQMFRYEGGISLHDVIAFSLYLFNGQRLGSFADDVSSPEALQGPPELPMDRSLFVVYVPNAEANGNENLSEKEKGTVQKEVSEQRLQMLRKWLGWTQAEFVKDEVVRGAEIKKKIAVAAAAEKDAAGVAESGDVARSDAETSKLVVELTKVDGFRWASSVVSRWLVEQCISYGRTRFGELQESRLALHSAVRGGSDEERFSQFMRAARRAVVDGDFGPHRVVLIALSDAYKRPVVYSGPWMKSLDAPRTNVASWFPTPLRHMEVHDQLLRWVNEHSLSAVTEITAETYPILAKRSGLTVLFIERGPWDKVDQSIRRTLREVVQDRNAALLAAQRMKKAGVEALDTIDSDLFGIPLQATDLQPLFGDGKTLNFTFGYVDANVHSEFIKDLRVDPQQLPAIIAFQIRKELVYYPSPALTALQSGSNGQLGQKWDANGVQAKQIAMFLRQIERGDIEPVRTSWVGQVAEYVLAVPFAQNVHEWLGSDDTTFLAVVGVTLFAVLIFGLALRSGGGGGGSDRVTEAEIQAMRQHEAFLNSKKKKEN